MRTDIRNDPSRFYDRLLAAGVYRSQVGPWLVGRYEEAFAATHDEQWSRDPSKLGRQSVTPDGQINYLDMSMLNRDPPEHTRLRRMVQKAFVPSAVARQREEIRGVVQELLGDLSAGEFDFYRDFAAQIPLVVICKMLGVPTERRDDFARWGHAAVARTEPTHDAGDLDEVRRLNAECVEFFSALVETKLRDPGDDLISMLVADDSDGRAGADDVISMSILLHVAGHETTANLLANGMFNLLTHPDQYDLLCTSPENVVSAVEEMLRYDSPARNTTVRYALEPFTWAGHEIVPGDQLFVVLAAANRDPGVFDDPHRFDITRPNNRHLSFGSGIHHCIGAALARLEATVVFEELIANFGRLELLDGGAEWRDSFVIRGLDKLNVRWSETVAV